MYGFCIRNEGLFAYLRGEVMRGKIRNRRKRIICNCGRGKCDRYHVVGHVAAERCYISGIKNDRWNIAEEDRHVET